MRRASLCLLVVLGLLIGPSLLTRHASSWSVRYPAVHQVGQFFLPTLYATLPATEACGGTFPTGSWTAQVGTWTNTGGLCHSSSGAQHNHIFWNADSFSTAHYSFVTISATDLYPGVECMASDTAGSRNAYYMYGTSGSSFEIYKVVAGADSIITTRSQAWTTGDKMKMECDSATDTIRVYIDTGGGWAQMGADITGQTDLNTGSAGMHMFGSAARLDTWEGGDIGGAAAAACKLTLLGVGC